MDAMCCPGCGAQQPLPQDPKAREQASQAFMQAHQGHYEGMPSGMDD